MAENVIVTKCFSCNRKLITGVNDGTVVCNKCLEYNVLKNGKPIKTIPKELYYGPKQKKKG